MTYIIEVAGLPALSSPGLQAASPLYRAAKLRMISLWVATVFETYSRARQESPEPFREPVGNHPDDVGAHHYRRRELRIVAREAVGVLHEEMVEVRQHARSHVLIAALLERSLHQCYLLGHRLLVARAGENQHRRLHAAHGGSRIMREEEFHPRVSSHHGV